MQSKNNENVQDSQPIEESKTSKKIWGLEKKDFIDIVFKALGLFAILIPALVYIHTIKQHNENLELQQKNEQDIIVKTKKADSLNNRREKIEIAIQLKRERKEDSIRLEEATRERLYFFKQLQLEESKRNDILIASLRTQANFEKTFRQKDQERDDILKSTYASIESSNKRSSHETMANDKRILLQYEFDILTDITTSLHSISNYDIGSGKYIDLKAHIENDLLAKAMLLNKAAFTHYVKFIEATEELELLKISRDNLNEYIDNIDKILSYKYYGNFGKKLIKKKININDIKSNSRKSNYRIDQIKNILTVKRDLIRDSSFVEINSNLLNYLNNLYNISLQRKLSYVPKKTIDKVVSEYNKENKPLFKNGKRDFLLEHINKRNHIESRTKDYVDENYIEALDAIQDNKPTINLLPFMAELLLNIESRTIKYNKSLDESIQYITSKRKNIYNYIHRELVESNKLLNLHMKQ